MVPVNHSPTISVRNGSGIIAQHGLSNAKPFDSRFNFADTRDKLLIKDQHKTEVKSSLNENMEVYLATVTYFMCDLLFENGCFVKILNTLRNKRVLFTLVSWLLIDS